LFIQRLVDKQTGRALTVESSQNALQFYTGTYLNQIKGRQRAVYNKYSGLCLETQNFTDSVNNQVNSLSNFISLEMYDFSHNFQA